MHGQKVPTFNAHEDLLKSGLKFLVISYFVLYRMSPQSETKRSFIGWVGGRGEWACVGILEQSMWARNRVGKGMLYRPARLHRLAESIPGLLKSLKMLCFIYTKHGR